MKKAIVLSGGGARGSYQVGVWKALRKVNYKFDIVTGTSIGALNGVLFVQGDFKRAYKIWKNISFKDVFGSEFDINLDLNEKKKVVTNMFILNMFSRKKISADNIENMLDKIVNYKKFYKSKIDFGLMTVNLTEFKYEVVVKNEIPKEHLKDYLIGSAALFPGFSKKKIEENSYIDGGFYDNLPINLAIDMGATEIIAVDLKAPGIKQRVKDSSVKIKYIYPKVDLDSILLFDKQQAIKNMTLGYHDGLKAFNELDGNLYTFKKGHVDKILNRYQRKFRDMFNSFEKNIKPNKILGYVVKKRISSKLNNQEGNLNRDLFIEILDLLGGAYSLEVAKVYSMKEFNKTLLQNFSKSEDDTIKSIFSKAYAKRRDGIIKYLYLELSRSKGLINNKILTIGGIFYKEALAAMYIYVIKKDN